ncbi:hypothetical protein [Shimia sp. SK013]|uniref:hypothetical protein n=1 Tax=Shimia sp. SK013 TaxID=1389006 RepID=UPI001F4C7FD7|nr:hypothetical protein [Shimia sp. SK013]
MGIFLLPEITLSPPLATGLFVLFVLSGHRFRKVWKDEGPRWQLWLSGVIAAVCLLTVALFPLTA